HTLFEELVSEGATPSQVAISLSALLPSTEDALWYDREEFSEAFYQLTDSSDAALQQLLTEVDTAFAEFAPILKLGTPCHSLASFLESEDPMRA
ncbi:MAG: HDOD domain-containing protein, partial [Planctomycetota bacterium]